MSARALAYIPIVKCLFGQKRSIDRFSTNGPQIKHSFLCAMFASETVWRLLYSFPLLFLYLTPYAFRQRGSYVECETYSPVSCEVNYFAINLLLQTQPLDATRRVFTSKFISECGVVYRVPHSKSLTLEKCIASK